MAGHKRPDGWNESDLRIAVGKVLLGSNEKAGEFANVTERTVYNRLNDNGDFIVSVVRVLEEAMRLRRRDTRDIAVEDQIKELSKRYAKAMAVVDEALDKGDIETARLIVREGIDRNHGKARQTMKVEGENHNFYHFPPELAAAMSGMAQMIEGSKRMYLPLPTDIPEADVVITTDSSE